MRRRPYSVILFDEIEKAHSDVFHIFLQVFDDGRLTDGQGRTVNFSNCAIIMTSNVGSAMIKQMDKQMVSGIDAKSRRGAILKELDRRFRPEFLNRLDEIIIFHSLEREHIARIVDMQLKDLSMMLAERHISFTIADGAKMRLAELGWDPVYGARPLKRALQSHVKDRLAIALLDGQIKDGDQVWIGLDAEGDRIVINSKTETQTALKANLVS